MNRIAEKKPLLGISSCLTGMPARYNGEQAGRPWFLQAMASHFDWLPVCPEIGAGMGAPRETVRLVEKEDQLLLLGSTTGKDYTQAMKDYSAAFLAGFSARRPHGFILKKKSPTCGLARVTVYNKAGKKAAKASGMFASMLKATMPMLPIEEEGRLNDSGLRTNFIEKVYAYRTLQEEILTKPSVAKLLAFHTSQKLALMARDSVRARRLGQMVAQVKTIGLRSTLDAYGPLFMETMSKKPSAGMHANVLQHLMGYLKQSLNGEEKKEILRLIHQFQAYLVPLSVPLTLLKHHLAKLTHPWVAQQSYLAVYPDSLLMYQTIDKLPSGFR